MTLAEFRGWQAFCSEEPLPGDWQRQAVSVLLPLIGNGFGGPGEGEAFSAADFVKVPWASEPQVDQANPPATDNTSFEALSAFLRGK
jgi:hypothetical protein